MDQTNPPMQAPEPEDLRHELSLESFAYALAEIPFVKSPQEGEEYAGPPNKRLAFIVSETMGMEGCEALLRFAQLACDFAKLGGESYEPNYQITGPLEHLLTDVEKERKAQKKGTVK